MRRIASSIFLAFILTINDICRVAGCKHDIVVDVTVNFTEKNWTVSNINGSCERGTDAITLVESSLNSVLQTITGNDGVSFTITNADDESCDDDNCCDDYSCVVKAESSCVSKKEIDHWKTFYDTNKWFDNFLGALMSESTSFYRFTNFESDWDDQTTCQDPPFFDALREYLQWGLLTIFGSACIFTVIGYIHSWVKWIDDIKVEFFIKQHIEFD